MIERVDEEKTKSGANKRKHYSTVHIKQKRLRRWDKLMQRK